MAVAGGPNLSENGLVFYYDTDNGKSYKGEPTTNLIGNFVSHYNNEEYWVRPTNFYQLEATAPYVVDPTAPGGAYVHATGNTSDTNAQIFWSAGNTICNEYGQQVSVSAWLRGSGEVRLIAYDDTTGYKSSPAITLTQEWTYYKYSTTFGSGGAQNNHWVGVREITNGEYVQVAKMQWERKPHATQYVKGTRSATESLYDFISDTALDVSNVSFDSNADITFDGTDELIQTPKIITTSDFTIEQVIYEVSYISEGWTFEQYNYGGGRLIVNSDPDNRLRFFIGGSAVTSVNIIPLNTYHHIVCIREGATAYIYENGVLTASGGISTNAIDDFTSAIGGSQVFSSGKQFNGSIPLTKVYNRALTAEEVQNNFNGIRSRFGI